MAHGAHAGLKRVEGRAAGVGSRRIFPPHFKLQVLDSYRNDADCKGNQRATARKYGIHRRQIQKWLQVEGNLRNSVVRTPAVTTPKDDPATRKEPLDFTTTSRPPIAPTTPPCSPYPIDLSVKRPVTPLRSPVMMSSPQRSLSPEHSSISPPQDSLVWDLSNKRKEMEDPSPSKPVKLFKPYLDDLHEDSTRISTPNSNYDYYNNNNNNNHIYDTYTIQELHPKNSIIYYYPLYPLFPSPEPAPYPGSYEGSPEGFQSKSRQSYSLDFKLSAIDSYYQDENCRGSQRAVAGKYNINRRQVQKWLQQEDELRNRDKHVHVLS